MEFNMMPHLSKVILRSGEVGIFDGVKNCVLREDGRTLVNYNNKLKHNESSEWDIVEVIRFNSKEILYKEKLIKTTKRKHNVNNINLQIDDIEVWKPPILDNRKRNNYGVIRISWSSDIGFGQYDLCKNENGEWIGYSETMDCDDDKDFIRKLMELMIDKLKIVD